MQLFRVSPFALYGAKNRLLEINLQFVGLAVPFVCEWNFHFACPAIYVFAE